MSHCRSSTKAGSSTLRSPTKESTAPPPNQFAGGVYSSSQVKGVVIKSWPDGLTNSGKRSNKRIGSGKRQTKLHAITRSNWPISVRMHCASPCSKLSRVRSIVGSTETDSCVVPEPSSSRTAGCTPSARMRLAALINA